MNFNGIILTTNLVGILAGQERHTTEQVVVADCTPVGSRHSLILRTKIVHTDRVVRPCVRKTIIAGEVVKSWVRGEAPFFVKEFIWRGMSPTQRLNAYLKRLDDGFGYSYEEL